MRSYPTRNSCRCGPCPRIRAGCKPITHEMHVCPEYHRAGEAHLHQPEVPGGANLVRDFDIIISVFSVWFRGHYESRWRSAPTPIDAPVDTISLTSAQVVFRPLEADRLSGV